MHPPASVQSCGLPPRTDRRIPSSSRILIPDRPGEPVVEDLDHERVVLGHVEEIGGDPFPAELTRYVVGHGWKERKGLHAEVVQHEIEDLPGAQFSRVLVQNQENAEIQLVALQQVNPPHDVREAAAPRRIAAVEIVQLLRAVDAEPHGEPVPPEELAPVRRQQCAVGLNTVHYELPRLQVLFLQCEGPLEELLSEQQWFATMPDEVHQPATRVLQRLSHQMRQHLEGERLAA